MYHLFHSIKKNQSEFCLSVKYFKRRCRKSVTKRKSMRQLTFQEELYEPSTSGGLASICAILAVIARSRFD